MGLSHTCMNHVFVIPAKAGIQGWRGLTQSPPYVMGQARLRAKSTANYNRPMLVADIGEFELIGRLESSIRERNHRQIDLLREHGVHLVLGIGDDAAAWRYPESTVVSTTDTMVENVHFLVGRTPWRELGWKVLASNLSDVGAMGCEPTVALVTLGLRPDLPLNGLIEMYDGMMDVLECTGGALVGGDIVRSQTFFVSVALEGISESGAQVMRRDSARPGDAVAVTGHLGCSAGGLRLILGESASPHLDSTTRCHLTTAHNRPQPRVAEGIALRKLGVKCAMDVSDGLTADLAKVCAASNLSTRIEADKVPADAHLKQAFPTEWLQLALGGGEDYELVFCADDRTMESVISELGSIVRVIGRISDNGTGVTVLDADGDEVMVGTSGWDHFSRQHG